MDVIDSLKRLHKSILEDYKESNNIESYEQVAKQLHIHVSKVNAVGHGYGMFDDSEINKLSLAMNDSNIEEAKPSTYLNKH